MTDTEKGCDWERLVDVVSSKLKGRIQVALDKPSHEAAEACLVLKAWFCAEATCKVRKLRRNQNKLLPQGHVGNEDQSPGLLTANPVCSHDTHCL